MDFAYDEHLPKKIRATSIERTYCEHGVWPHECKKCKKGEKAMEMDNMELWNKVKQPPKEALKTIGGGRLKGMTDISPQWRYEALTKEFGPCGTGWWYEIKRTWNEIYTNEVTANAEISLYIGENKPIPGIGGSKISTTESKGVYVSDEAYKMAVTDAISVAAKVLGFGADIYAGKWDGSKYLNTAPQSAATGQKPSQSTTKTPTPVKQGPDGGDGKIIIEGNQMLKEMSNGDPNVIKALVCKHSRFDGDTGRVERERLEDLKGKWLFKTFKNLENEYSLFIDSQKNVESAEMSIAEDIPLFEET